MMKDTEVDFNVFVGAETGILKGVNVHNKGNIAKNFHNLKSLDKEYEITCASFGDGEGEILMGLRNQSVKVDSWALPMILTLVCYRYMMSPSVHLVKA